MPCTIQEAAPVQERNSTIERLHKSGLKGGHIARERPHSGQRHRWLLRASTPLLGLMSLSPELFAGSTRITPVTVSLT